MCLSRASLINKLKQKMSGSKYHEDVHITLHLACWRCKLFSSFKRPSFLFHWKSKLLSATLWDVINVSCEIPQPIISCQNLSNEWFCYHCICQAFESNTLHLCFFICIHFEFVVFDQSINEEKWHTKPCMFNLTLKKLKTACHTLLVKVQSM